MKRSSRREVLKIETEHLGVRSPRFGTEGSAGRAEANILTVWESGKQRFVTMVY